MEDFSEYGDQDALDSIDDYNRFEEREVFNDNEGRDRYSNPSLTHCHLLIHR